MPDIDNIQIEIGASASDATSQIKELNSALEKIQQTLNGNFKNPFKNMNIPSASAGTSTRTSRRASNDDQYAPTKAQISRINGTDRSARGLGQSYDPRPALETANSLERMFREDDAARAAAEQAKAWQKVSDAIRGVGTVAQTVFRSIASAARGVLSVLGSVTSAVGRGIGGAFKKLFEGSVFGKIGRFTSGIASMGKAVGRIAVYRMLRAAIRAVVQTIKEGAENAYYFAKKYGDATKYIADAHDRLASGSFTMGNQLGAAWATLLATIQPILSAIISLIQRAAAVITQFFALLGGKSTYLAADKYAKSWADSTSKGAKSAKEWKNQLLGFDEINRLDEPAQGGGGGGGGKPTDYNKMFHEEEIDSRLKSLYDNAMAAIKSGNWKELGTLLGEAINQIFPTKEKWDEWGKKFGYGLNGVFATLHQMLETIDFKGWGSNIASFINNALEEMDFTHIGALAVRKWTIIFDLILNGLLDLDWKLIGVKIGEFFSGAFDEASRWIDQYNWSAIGNILWNDLVLLVQGINFNEVARKFFQLLGKAFAALTQLLESFFSHVWAAIKEYFQKKMEEAGGNTWKGFLNGILDAAAGIWQWLETNVFTPFVEGFMSLFGIHSPSTVMAEIGENVIQGFWNGLKEKWEAFRLWIDEKLNAFKSWWQSFNVGNLKLRLPHIEVGHRPADSSILKFFGVSSIPTLTIKWKEYAKGGFPEDGLFMANHGEMVGKFSNGKTAVANNEQIIAGIKQGVKEALVEGLGYSSGYSSDNREIAIYLDGKQIARTTTKYQRQIARAEA